MSEPRSLAVIREAITLRSDFTSPSGIRGRWIAVMTGHIYKNELASLTGPLAAVVRASAYDLYARYMGEAPRISPDDPTQRGLYSDEAIYYVTSWTEEAQHVLGYLTATGEAVLSPDLRANVRRDAAILSGLVDAGERVRRIGLGFIERDGGIYSRTTGKPVTRDGFAAGSADA